MRRFFFCGLLVTALAALAACGDAGTYLEVRGDSASTTTTTSSTTTPTTTECQDHTLPCAGPTTTIPVLDPSKKDETMISDAISIEAPPTTVALPRTS